MNATQAALRGKDTAAGTDLFISFELGDKAWKLAFSNGHRNPGLFTAAAGDKAAVLDCIARAKRRCALPDSADVHSWARWLVAAPLACRARGGQHRRGLVEHRGKPPGPPRLDVHEGDMRKLQFAGPPCVLDVFLYPLRPGAEPVATSVDARRESDGRDVDSAACVAALARGR
jgi:hypothetical protein